MATTKVNVSKISDFPKVTPAGTDYILVEKDGQGGSITLSQIPVSKPVEDKITEEVNKLNSQINDLAFLPEGSTAADAELISIRTPADGFTVPAGSNAGNAVRAQITQLDEKISNLKGDLDNYVYKNGVNELTADNADFIIKNMSENVCDNETITSGYTMNIDGNIIENANRAVTDYIYCYDKSVFSTNTGLTGAHCFYGKNKNFLGYKPYANVRLNLPIPTEYDEPVYYMRLSMGIKAVGMFGVYFAETAPAYIPYSKTLELSRDIKVNNESLPNILMNIVNYYSSNPKRIIANLIKNGGTLKFIGDSITQGVGGTGFEQDGDDICTIGSTTWKVNTNGYCFANLVKNYVQSKYPNVTVKNYGTMSFTSSNLKAQIQLNNILDGTEDVVICMIGTNDKWNGSLETLKLNIQYIIDICKTNGTKLILMSAPISTVECDTNYNGNPVQFHNEDIDHAYNQVCNDNNIPYISMYQKMLEEVESLNIAVDSIFSDGLHPNDEGYYIMYKIIMRELGIAYQMPSSN